MLPVDDFLDVLAMVVDFFGLEFFVDDFIANVTGALITLAALGDGRVVHCHRP